MKKLLQFIGSILLFAIAFILFLPLTLLNFTILLIKGKGRKYFLSSAINLDRFGNYEFRTLFNLTLKKKHGYEFGDFRETISSALGKNQRDETLTFTGRALAKILDTIDRDHCKKSIKNLAE